MLIESVNTVNHKFLQKQKILFENRIILGMKVRVMIIQLPKKLKKWHIVRLRRQIIEHLRKLRINTVCLKKDFPYPEWFGGYRKPDDRYLISRLLGKIALINANEHEAVYVRIEDDTRSCKRTLSDLCKGFRYILLDGKNTEVAEMLYKTYGASVVINPKSERIATADAAVFFNEPFEMPQFKEECVIIKAYDTLNVEFSFASGVEHNIPDGYPQIPLISEAILRGCIGIDDINIIKSEISP